jgi:1-acyl-sn-glycerol-3-phosphate acyltransferase
LPIALNSCNNWPKHTFIKTPGKIIIKILKPIPAKLKKDEVLEKIESVIEEETNKIK